MKLLFLSVPPRVDNKLARICISIVRCTSLHDGSDGKDNGSMAMQSTASPYNHNDACASRCASNLDGNHHATECNNLFSDHMGGCTLRMETSATKIRKTKRKKTAVSFFPFHWKTPLQGHLCCIAAKKENRGQFCFLLRKIRSLAAKPLITMRFSVFSSGSSVVALPVSSADIVSSMSAANLSINST